MRPILATSCFHHQLCTFYILKEFFKKYEFLGGAVCVCAHARVYLNGKFLFQEVEEKP